MTVDENTVLLELTNPDVEIQTLNADRAQTDAESQLVQLKTNLNSNKLAQAAAVANLRSTWLDAKRRAESGAELLKKGLIIPLDQQKAQELADALGKQVEFEEERLKIMTNTIAEQIRVQEEQVSRLKSITAFQHGLKASMVVRAGTHGVLSEIPSADRPVRPGRRHPGQGGSDSAPSQGGAADSGNPGQGSGHRPEGLDRHTQRYPPGARLTY